MIHYARGGKVVCDVPQFFYLGGVSFSPRLVSCQACLKFLEDEREIIDTEVSTQEKGTPILDRIRRINERKNT